MTDNRVINLSYAEKPVILFTELSKLMLDPAICAGPPVVLNDKVTIVQLYGQCPHSGGVPLYYRMDGDELLVWDPEMNIELYDKNAEECGPDEATHVVKIGGVEDLSKFLGKIMTGEL